MNKKVIVLGGGVAGMSAAHELSERGFEVEVYELKTIAGGKARSMDVPGTMTAGKKPLPGEHGFRFFPRFYKHITETMKRIPVDDKGRTAFDNLVQASRGEIARYGKEPIEIVTRFPRTLDDIHDMIKSFYGNDSGLTDEDMEFYAERLWQLMTSCYQRRLAEYEKMSWWDFIKAEGRSPAYQSLLATGLTRTLVAAQAKKASARTGGDILLQLIFDITRPGESTDRLLNGPTNEVWIDPWLTYLTTQKNVKYDFETKVLSINCDGTKITGATLEKNGNKLEVTGDYYIAAMPVEVLAPMLSDQMTGIDTSLLNIKKLSDSVSWMNGIQFYLNEEVPIVHGHVIYIDSEWALTSISQAQFWKDHPIPGYGDGQIKGILSVDVSDWFNPGELFTDPVSGKKKSAHECTADEIKQEIWHQLKKSLNIKAGKEILKDDMLIKWHLDPDIRFSNVNGNLVVTNEEPLLVNNAGTWELRPEAFTKIPNFFLASDYIRTYTDLATMEGANEAARRAVNSIIDVSGAKVPKCEIWNLYEPEILEPFRWYDEIRFNQGLPWKGKIPTRVKNFLDKLIDWLRNILKKIGIKI